MLTSSFTADASGDPDPIQVPDGAEGCREAEIIPPVGHAWTLALPLLTSTPVPYVTDATAKITRHPGRPPFNRGDIVGYAALDTGSGTFYVRWS